MAYKAGGQDDPLVLAFVVSHGPATVLFLGPCMISADGGQWSPSMTRG
jgi:hypothetical protein